jgi:hypothetical protein
MKYSFNSSSFSAWNNKVILLAGGILIIQIIEFFDMFLELIFNLYTNIQIWMSIVT